MNSRINELNLFSHGYPSNLNPSTFNTSYAYISTPLSPSKPINSSTLKPSVFIILLSPNSMISFASYYSISSSFPLALST